MSENAQQSTCRNLACGNHRLTVKHYFKECTQWMDNKRKYGIHNNNKELLEKNCKVGKVMKFLKEIGMFEQYKFINIKRTICHNFI